MPILFWSAVLFVAYTYIGYPAIIYFLARVRRKTAMKNEILPEVSVVIAAWNGEKTIRRRIENILAQDYPGSRLEIVVVSDGSTDRTEEEVASVGHPAVYLIPLRQRFGKAVALNCGIRAARGEIVVFTDVRQIFAPDAVRQLVANFSDPEVGCVSGELVFRKDGVSLIAAEMNAYWRYEKWIRMNEGESGSVVGATGAIYSIRKDLYDELPPGAILDDLLTPLNAAAKGYRVIFDGSAVAWDEISTDAEQEQRRKVRTLAGNWQLLTIAPHLFVPGANPVWWRFISHKFFRLLVPFMLPVIFVAGALEDGGIYRLATALQILCYLMAVVAALVPATRSRRLLNMAYFFMVLNHAAVIGLWTWLSGGCADAWTKGPMKTESS